MSNQIKKNSDSIISLNSRVTTLEDSGTSVDLSGYVTQDELTNTLSFFVLNSQLDTFEDLLTTGEIYFNTIAINDVLINQVIESTDTTTEFSDTNLLSALKTKDYVDNAVSGLWGSGVNETDILSFSAEGLVEISESYKNFDSLVWYFKSGIYVYLEEIPSVSKDYVLPDGTTPKFTLTNGASIDYLTDTTMEWSYPDDTIIRVVGKNRR